LTITGARVLGSEVSCMTNLSVLSLVSCCTPIALSISLIFHEYPFSLMAGLKQKWIWKTTHDNCKGILTWNIYVRYSHLNHKINSSLWDRKYGKQQVFYLKLRDSEKYISKPYKGKLMCRLPEKKQVKLLLKNRQYFSMSFSHNFICPLHWIVLASLFYRLASI
jgi:hypothetical protein